MSGSVVQNQLSISEYIGSNDNLGNRQDIQLCSLICDVRTFESKSEVEILIPLLTKMVNQREYIFLEKFQKLSISSKTKYVGFPGGAVVENLPANAGDTGSSPGLGRSHMPRSS